MKHFFVVGYMHSGTTLLQNIIGRHSSVLNIDGESKYFESLPVIRTKFKDLRDQVILENLIIFTINSIYHGFSIANGEQKILKSEKITEKDLKLIKASLLEPISYCSVFRDIFDYIAEKEEKNGWLEKTPSHILHVNDILECMEDARIVEIIRDPRDILASKKTRRNTVWTNRYDKSQQQKKHYEKAYDPVWDTLSWKSFIHAGIKQKIHTKNIYTVHYEELTNKPEEIIKNICDFLDIEFESNMLDVGQGVPSDITIKRNEGITTQSNGRWKKSSRKMKWQCVKK